MPEIGATLRETRMRQGLEISDIEASTKIRAKYLRAIENEEWDLLPGTTFVKSFLRTYAEALDLDSRLLLEGQVPLRAVRRPGDPGPQRPSSHPSSGRERRPPRRGHPGRWILLACAAMVVVILLFLLGSGDDEPARKGVTSTTTPAETKTTDSGEASVKTTRTTASDTTARAGRTVRLKIVPTADVYSCHFAGKKRLITGQTLTPSDPSATYRSKRFIVVLGNGDATLSVNGKTVKVPQSDQPIGYEITSAGRSRIAVADLPTC